MKNLYILRQNLVTKLSEIWVEDPGSAIRKNYPDPGVKKAPDPRSATLQTIFFKMFSNNVVK
jgi:hypothetical protein